MSGGLGVSMPRPELRPFVQAYYRLNGAGPDALVGGPGLSVDLWWLEGAEVAARLPGGGERRLSGAVIGGALTRMLSVRRRPESSGFGVSLAPGVAPALFGVSAGELSDRFLPLEDLLGAGSGAIVERVLEARGPFEKARVLESELRLRLAKAPGPDPRVAAALARLTGSLEKATVDGLAGELGLTRRRLQDLVRDSLGVSPKLLIRILRFRKALRMIAAGPARVDWLDVVSECGYADQSHLIRHFREFTGRTPVEFAARGALPPLSHQVPRLDA